MMLTFMMAALTSSPRRATVSVICAVTSASMVAMLTFPGQQAAASSVTCKLDVSRRDALVAGERKKAEAKRGAGGERSKGKYEAKCSRVREAKRQQQKDKNKTDEKQITASHVEYLLFSHTRA
eukprot:161640-Rhodomonas_salina.1